MGSNVPLLFLVHCTKTTITLTLIELASSTADRCRNLRSYEFELAVDIKYFIVFKFLNATKVNCF